MRKGDWRTIAFGIGLCAWVVFLIASDTWRQYAQVFAIIAIVIIVALTTLYIVSVVQEAKDREARRSRTINVHGKMRDGLNRGRTEAQENK